MDFNERDIINLAVPVRKWLKEFIKLTELSDQTTLVISLDELTIEDPNPLDLEDIYGKS